MSNLPISQLPITVTADTTDVIAIVNNGETKQITRNNFLNNIPEFSGNTDNLGGSTMRTIYSRTNVIEYVDGVNDSDLFSGSTNFGSRNFPQEFFTNSVNYVDKIVHFRVTGKSGGVSGPDIGVQVQFGNDVLTNVTITASQADDKPTEIFGEIIISGGNATACYSVGYCSNNGDFKRYALSDASTPIDVSLFTGGDLKLIMSSNTTNDFTSYLGYIQVWN